VKATASFTGLVVDHCAGGGSESMSWPLSAAFERLRQGLLMCITEGAAGPTMEVVEEPSSCSNGLPATNGIRIRSLPA
jgi:hypothetical protein